MVISSCIARKTVVRATTALVALASIAVQAQANLETFVMATNGQTNFLTGGPPVAVYNNFNGFGGGVPGDATFDPSTLASYGVSGTYRQTVSPNASVLTDALATAGSGNSTFGPWTYSGSTSTTAQYGQLKSASQAVHTGNADNATVNNAESYSIMRETFVRTSPGVANGTSGSMQIAVAIDGNMSVTGTGGMGMLLRYNYGNRSTFVNSPTLLETSAHIYGNGYQIYGPHSSFGNFTTPPGMAYNIGPLNANNQPSFITFGGATTVYATVPFVYGVSDNFIMSLFTESDIGNGNGSMNSSFEHTAKITGIKLFNAGGTEVTDFSITSGSGTLYDASGVHLSVVPEPGTFALLLLGVLPIASMVIRRRSV